MLLLWEHEKARVDREQQMAAFTGYCAGKAFAMAFSEGLGDFSEFYQPARGSPPKHTTQDHIRMMQERGEGGPPIS